MKKALKGEMYICSIPLLVLLISLLTSCSRGMETKTEEDPAAFGQRRCDAPVLFQWGCRGV